MCYNVANAGREVYLLLYSLILNAGVIGRSQINEELKYPPANEEKGISLWSMSRYIKGIIYSILQASYGELSSHLEYCTKQDLDEYKKRIKELLGLNLK